MTRWYFNEHPEGAKRREPLVGEFFATESISNVVSGLVREFVQNSMDAALSPDAPVEVHFAIGQLELGEQTEKYFTSFWDHYDACDDRTTGGRRSDLRNEPCRYLIAEDFNTTGLRGDPTVSFIDTSNKVEETNDFYYFIRTEGASGKSTTDRGNWGVGKYTYAKTSNTNSFFAYSVRHDPAAETTPDTVLIGQSILNYHQIGDTVFQPDGWWGLLGGHGGAMPMPLAGALDETNDFRSDFGLFRDGEPGLSIVVPFVARDIDAEALMVAALGNYLTPIVRGQLSIVIRGDNDELHILNSTSIEQEVRNFKGGGLWEEFGPEIELVRWWHGNQSGGESDGFFELPKPAEANQLSWKDRFDDGIATAIRERLESAQLVSVRVPIEISSRGGSGEWSFVDLLLCPDPGRTVPPTFYREGIRISEVKSDKIPGIRAIVLADHKVVAGFLGAAEGPAHTDWKNNRDRFSGAYRNGRNILAFIKALPSGLVNRVRSGQDDTDLGVALEYWALPVDHDPGGRNRKPSSPAPSGEQEVQPPEPPEPPPPRKVRLGTLVGGCTIIPDDGLGAGETVTAVVAYDTLTGDPLRKWIKADFDLASESISVDQTGARVVDRSNNRLEFEVTDVDSFKVSVSGFDRNRDILVRVGVTS